MKQMNVFRLLIVMLFFSLAVQAGAPSGVNYQAVARDGIGTMVADQQVTLRISILSGQNQNQVDYVEIHHVTTNQFGLFNLTIGNGTSQTGKFTDVQWSKGDQWIKTEIQIGQSGTFTDLGVSKFQSVPYALHAATATKLLNSPNRALADSAWLLNGNSGTSAAINFMGTNDFEDVVFKSNGLERMRVKAQGEIGIGLVSPSTSLEINGDFRAGDGSNYFQIDPDGDGFFKGTGDYLLGPVDWVWRYQFDENFGQRYYNDNVSIHEYQYTTTGGTAIYELDAVTGRVHVHGDLGVGTPTPAGKLDVVGNALIGDFAGGNAATFNLQGDLEFQGTADYLVGADRYAFRYVTNQDYGLVFSLANLAYEFKTAGGTNVASIGANNGYLHAAGRVGAGISPADAVLQAQGNSIVGDYAGGNYAEVDADGDLNLVGTADYLVPGNRYAFRYAANENFGLFFNSSAGRYEFHDNLAAASAFVHATTGNGYFRGDVGIGVVAPLSEFHLVGDARVSTLAAGTANGAIVTSDMNGVMSINNFNGNSSDALRGDGTWGPVGGGSSLPPGSLGQTLMHDGTTWVASSNLFNDGTNVGVGTTSPTAKLEVNGLFKSFGTTEISDARYKKDIVQISDALNKVAQLRGVNYHWDTEAFANKPFNQDLQMGLIAQEVEKVVPEVVLTGADGYKSVDYSSLVALLIEAINDQQQVIDAQETEISSLNSRASQIDEMRAELDALKTLVTSVDASVKK